LGARLRPERGRKSFLLLFFKKEDLSIACLPSPDCPGDCGVNHMTEIELQDIIARIKRAQAETDKFVDEGRKLRAEAGKFVEEGYKLRAEGGKLQRERTTLAMTSGAAILGAGAVIGGLLLRLMTGH
jgi:hypothetical protein